MPDLDIRPLFSEIDRMVRYYVDARVELVDDVDRWCSENLVGVSWSAGHTSPIARAIWNVDGKPDRILLRAHIEHSVLVDHMLALRVSSLDRSVAPLLTEDAYLRHLVLHEIAHVKHNWGQAMESSCDEWAYEQLPLWVEA